MNYPMGYFGIGEESKEINGLRWVKFLHFSRFIKLRRATLIIKWVTLRLGRGVKKKG